MFAISTFKVIYSLMEEKKKKLDVTKKTEREVKIGKNARARYLVKKKKIQCWYEGRSWRQQIDM